MVVPRLCRRVLLLTFPIFILFYLDNLFEVFFVFVALRIDEVIEVFCHRRTFILSSDSGCMSSFSGFQVSKDTCLTT